MRLVERHIIKKSNPIWEECDKISFHSKNLYNQALYRVRQHFFNTGEYLNYSVLDKQLNSENQVDYRCLPAKVSQWVLKQLDQNFKSFFKTNKAYKKDPSKFTGRPKLPKYKHKTKGRFITTYTSQAISKRYLKEGIVKLSGADIKIKTKVSNINQARIIPTATCYVIEIVYGVKDTLLQTYNGKSASIDLGLPNLATVVFNFNESPIIINGKPLKSVNQFYNKKLSKLKSELPSEKKSSNNIKKLTTKRNNKIRDYMHKATRYLVNYLTSQGVTRVIVGKNNQWKTEINIGKKNNQNFVMIPHAKFINILEYKLLMNGIELIAREESYTSKCSYLDNEPIKKHEKYKGRRVKRSWFKTSKGFLIHADVNGAYNIGKKQSPKEFSLEEIEVPVVVPKRVKSFEQVA